MTLWPRKRIEASQERQEKLVQRREAEFGLRFDPHQADYVEAPSRLGGVIEKCRLSYARFALEHENGAHAIARCLKEAINLAAFIQAAHKQVMAVRQGSPAGGGTGISPLRADRITSVWGIQADLHTFPTSQYEPDQYH